MGRGSVSMMSTPLYSNTTLVSFFPTLGMGGAMVLMKKFDAKGFLDLATANRATHAMLVPVQYRRIMEREDFDTYDLSSFFMKFSTSAPFAAEIKADVLKRWPGGLIEYYGMTEGGGSFVLVAHEFPDKLHTVGRPAAGHDIRLLARGRNRSCGGRDRRGYRPLTSDDERLPQPARQDRRGRVVRRGGQAVHPYWVMWAGSTPRVSSP